MYLDNVAELRKQRDAEEAEAEKMLEEEKNKIEAERKERMDRLREARQKLEDVSWL